MVKVRDARPLRALRAVAANRSGVSAVEFALILPLMLLLYAGSIELSEALSADRKANRVASTIGDLVTQESSLTSAKMTGIFDASSAVMRPFPIAGRLKTLVMQVYIDKDGKQTVNWAEAYGGETDPPNNTTPPITVPAALATNDSYVIVTRVIYTYESPFSSYTQGVLGRATKGYTLSHVFTMKPRSGQEVRFP